MVQHRNDYGHIEAIVVEGNRRAIVEDGYDFIDETKVLKVKGYAFVATLTELLAKNAVPATMSRTRSAEFR